ncbi:hypothetical protein ANN_01345 [Periplaneta americana]|uniref:Uncharacterized protein n=1 Tax=Periplaneta americana TaxID=6978 RepID=A0ABQ8TTB8_PERAM|nr:hypothetical protein ANN_01345 [Periplaneta americana]
MGSKSFSAANKPASTCPVNSIISYLSQFLAGYQPGRDVDNVQKLHNCLLAGFHVAVSHVSKFQLLLHLRYISTWRDREFTAVITGHGRTKSYLHRFHIIDDPTCTCGRGQQTVNHLIYECADTTQQRTSLMRDIRMNGGDWPLTCQQLVNSEMSPGSSTESYPAFARIGLRENPGKYLNQVTCPNRDSNPGHLDFAARRADRYSTAVTDLVGDTSVIPFKAEMCSPGLFHLSLYTANNYVRVFHNAGNRGAECNLKGVEEARRELD